MSHWLQQSVLQNTFGKEWGGRGRSGVPMASKLHPAFLHKTHSPHHVGRATREGSTGHTSTSCVAGQAKAARGPWAGPHWRNPGRRTTCRRGARGNLQVGPWEGKGARCRTTALADGLLKGPIKRRYLAACWAITTAAPCFWRPQYQEAQPTTKAVAD